MGSDGENEEGDDSLLGMKTPGARLSSPTARKDWKSE